MSATGRPLDRAAAGMGPGAPVRIVHLGVGAFFRAHQAWYTSRAADAEAWGIAAYTGRSRSAADDLHAQDGVYTLVTRDADADRHQRIGSISRAHPADAHDRWLADLSDPAVGLVTITVTEAGWCRTSSGSLDRTHPVIVADVDALRHNPTAPVVSAPARLLSGLAARRRADAGPIALVPCDNLGDNGAVVRRVLGDLAEALDPALGDWLDTEVAIASTMVDRITPAATDADRAAVAAATGWRDRAVVVTEPYHEWVLSGLGASDHPDWMAAGARFVDDVTPFEQRKLMLLNGAHSLLAYLGQVRGHLTVADAIDDEDCRSQVLRWWDEAGRHLGQAPEEVARYTDALLGRFANPRLEHRLAQIAVDGSQKLPVRILPTLRSERAAGRLPEAAAGVLAAWITWLRRGVMPLVDVRAAELAEAARGPLAASCRRLVALLDPALADDRELIDVVIEIAAELAEV